MAQGRMLSCCCLLLLTRLGAGSKCEALLQYPVCVLLLGCVKPAVLKSVYVQGCQLIGQNEC